MLFADSALRKTNFLRRMPDNVLLMSTSAYLRGLQRRGLLNDAGAILQRAVAVRGPDVARDDLRATTGAGEAPLAVQAGPAQRTVISRACRSCCLIKRTTASTVTVSIWPAMRRS